MVVGYFSVFALRKIHWTVCLYFVYLGCCCFVFEASLMAQQLVQELPWWLSRWRICLQCRRCRRHGFDPWVRKIPWRRAWQHIPVFLPGKFHGQRRLVGLLSVASQRVGHEWSDWAHTYLHKNLLTGNDPEPMVHWILCQAFYISYLI